MIIIGLNSRAKKVKSGSFDCPHCGKTRLYDHKRSKLYFSFFFIPLIPLKDQGEFIECQHCFRQYAVEILQRKPLTAVERHAFPIKIDLQSGTPIEMARQKLLNQGFASEFVEEVIEKAAGSSRRSCPRCSRTYVKTIEKCAECGHLLD